MKKINFKKITLTRENDLWTIRLDDVVFAYYTSKKQAESIVNELNEAVIEPVVIELEETKDKVE